MSDLSTVSQDAPTPSHSKSWAIDKTIPVALIAAMVIQCFFFVFFIGQETAKLTEHDRRITTLELTVESRGKTLLELSEHIASLDGKMSLLLDAISQIRNNTPHK